MPRKKSEVERERITIRLDADVLKYFRDMAERDERAYQVLINKALRMVAFNEGRNFNSMPLQIPKE